MVPLRGQTRSLLLAMTSARRAMSPQFLLFFLLLKITCTSCLSVRNDYDENFYMHGNIRCQRCPAGTYVLQHCTTPDSRSDCTPCSPGYSYSEHLTGLDECLQCTVCRPDEEEVTPCTVTKNTVCKCKKGTFCPLDGPCEICQKCTTSCPPDLVELKPCNATADMQCGPQDNASIDITAILVPVFIIFLFLVAAFCLWYFCCKKNRKQSKWMSKLNWRRWGCREAPAGDVEAPFLSRSKLQWKSRSENEMNEAINKTLNTFVDLVPFSEFERFVRSLGLPQNYIDRAKEDNKTSYNQQFAMLLQLYWDKRFDVNIWLDKLRDNKMRTVAEEVTKRLIKEGLFETLDG
ncbi:tumor necrosis factor receptor superfamily member 6-like [Leptodactylus fuscus]|uniref:tumor necrosis factor receptor superfamily member 6-like n=1 Tax=Leptodactylus fuscus TaxID=238119 RepID=UPI003F4F15F0